MIIVMVRGIVGIVVIAFGLMFIVRPWKAHFAQKRLASEGVRATATVTGRDIEKRASRDSQGGLRTYYIIQYTFETETGRPIECKRGIDKEKWDNLFAGSKIEVIYDSDDPENQFPVGQATMSSLTMPMIIVTSFGMLVVALGVLVILWPLIARAVQKRREDPV